MALPAEHLRPAFRVIDGGSPVMRADEARIEVIAHFDEVIAAADELHAHVTALALTYEDHARPTDLRWRLTLETIGRTGARAAAARDEYLSLTDPDAAA